MKHLTGEEMPETRNVLVESARIARGNIQDLSAFDANRFDALIIPGGFGAGKNLSSYAFDGSQMLVDKQVEEVILAMWKQKKPIGALCIAPVILAKVLEAPTLTIGNDPSTIEHVELLGATHQTSTQTEVVIDNNNLLFTTPCYMLNARISEIAQSAENLVKKILKAL